MSFYRIIYSIFLYNLLYQKNLVEASNIDTQHPIFIKNSADGPESLFGTTILLVKDNNDSPGIIIGAPRGNSTLKSHEDIHEPGIVWQCSFERKSEVCRIMTMDETGNVRDNNRGNVTDRKDDGWLGGSIAQDAENVVTCGSRWSNQFYAKEKNQYFMNGICYWRPKTEMFENDLPVPSKESRLLPLVQFDQQAKNYWGLGQAGFSIHIPPKGKEMIIGAPGISAWKGSVIRYSNDASGNPFKTTVVIRPEKSEEILEDDSYFGFAVASGTFFKKDDNKNSVQYVSGAPRGNGLAGKVVVFRFPESENADKGKLEQLVKMDGKQIGSYFGASLCVADVNGDGFDDLLIGAPQYTIQHKLKDILPMSRSIVPSGYGDEGVVFVYLSTGTTLVEQSGSYLNGRYRAWSHFGSAIVNLGDINADGFADIAVGSPYELDGTGVVYIYHGGEKGIVKQFAQYIEGRQLDPLLKGFGYSFSEKQDIDLNGYNDLAIGAYDSGNVVILRTRPLITVHGIVKSDMKRLSFDTKSFDIESCVSFLGDNIPDKIALAVKILADSASKQPRVVLKRPELPGVASPEQIYDEEMYKEIESCTKFTAEIRTPLESSGKPVVIHIEIKVVEKEKPLSPSVYEIKSVGGQYITEISGEDYKSFCKNCPMLDKIKSTTHHLHLPLAVLCGDDDKCLSDLRISIKFPEITTGRPFVIGSMQVLTMQVEITNAAETAISPAVVIRWKKRNLKKIPAECQSFQSNDTYSSYKCSLGRLLEEGKTAMVLLDFDVSDIVAGNQNELWFQIEAITASDLIKPSVEIVSLPMIAIADIFMTGSSLVDTFNPETLIAQLNFLQTFEIGLDGPSPVAGTIIEFQIPVSFSSSSGSVTKIHVYDPRMDTTKISCSAVSGEFTTGQNPSALAVSSSIDLESPDIDLIEENPIKPLQMNEDLSQTKPETVRKISSKKASEVQIECSSRSVECMKVRCQTGTFSANSTITLTFPMSIASKNLKSLFRSKDVSFLKITSQGSMKLKDVEIEIQPDSDKPDNANAVTVIQLESTTKVPKWIIWGAVVMGFLVLAILVSCLYYCGVFERKSKAEPIEEETEGIPLQETTPFNSDNLDDDEKEEPDITKEEDD